MPAHEDAGASLVLVDHHYAILMNVVFSHFGQGGNVSAELSRRTRVQHRGNASPARGLSCMSDIQIWDIRLVVVQPDNCYVSGQPG